MFWCTFLSMHCYPLDLADEKFPALNLSSTSLADRSVSESTGNMNKNSVDDLRVNGGTHSSGGRVAGWAINLSLLLADDEGLRLFRVRVFPVGVAQTCLHQCYWERDIMA